MSPLPCPTCGAELAFLEQYQRHFCYHCQQYAPEGYGAKGEMKCPACGGILSYIVQYDRFYCYRCNTYPPAQPEPTPAPATVPEKAKEEIPAAATPEPAAAAPVPAVVEALTIIPPTHKPRADGPDEVKVVEAPATVTKPPLVREEILEARKPLLMDLCKAYDLDPSGTKEQLRERLLSYLDELEGEDRPEELEPASEPQREAEELPEEMPEELIPEVKLEPVPKSEEMLAQAPVAALVIQEERPPEPKAQLVPEAVQEPVTETRPEPQPQPQPVAQAIPAVAPSAPLKVEHPCPTCGRELEYISQYNRWYCYSCKAYAPAMAPKNACPSCGATMRWIERYRRWWCDSCRQYAAADLPAPRSQATAAPTAQVVLGAEAKPAVTVHRHRSPYTGIGLAALGLVLWIAYQVLVEVPRVFSVNLGIPLDRDSAFVLQFSGFLFLAVGVIVALVALKDRA